MVSKIPEQKYSKVVQYTASTESFRPVLCRYVGDACTPLQSLLQYLGNVEYIRKPRIVEQFSQIAIADEFLF